MRIHTDKLDTSLIRGAATAAQATIEILTEHGSRSRLRAFEVKLTGNSRRRPNGGSRGADTDVYAATWDQWGVFLGLLFDIDHTMTATYYSSAEEFHYNTDWRFENLDADHIEIPLSHDHTFRFAGIPREQECAKCGAVQRWGN